VTRRRGGKADWGTWRLGEEEERQTGGPGERETGGSSDQERGDANRIQDCLLQPTTV